MEAMGDNIGNVMISPDQATRLMCLSEMLRDGDLSIRASHMEDEIAAFQIIHDVAQEIALQVNQSEE